MSEDNRVSYEEDSTARYFPDSEVDLLQDQLNHLSIDLQEANDKLKEIASLIEDFLEDANPVDRRELEKFCRNFRV